MNTNAIAQSEFVALDVQVPETRLRSIKKCEQCPKLIEQQDTDPVTMAMPRLCVMCQHIANITTENDA